MSESRLTVPSSVFDRTAPVKITAEDYDTLRGKCDTETQRKVWREAQARALANADPVILGSYITRTAYRLVREWARTIGVIGYDQLLSELSTDKFIMPQPYGDPPAGPFCIRALAELRQALERTTDKRPKGIPLLPSPNGHFLPVARHYASAMRHLSEFLHLDDSEYGPLALPYLLQTPPNPHNWPEPSLLNHFETCFIDEILDVVLDQGVHNGEQFLLREHGLMPHEARGLIRLAKAEARNRMEAELDDERAILSMRLEDLIWRAKESLDMRVELGAIKQLAIVQGVTRAEPEDALSEFANVIKRVANEAQPRAINTTATALPPAEGST